MKKLFMAACGLLMGLSAVAQAPAAEKAPALPAWASMISVAGELVKYGYAEQEALPLIQAAEIYTTFNGGASKATAQTVADSNAAAETKGNNPVTFDVNKLLADAAAMAEGNQPLLALIDDIKNSGTRGATKDYEVLTTTVKAHSTDVYKVQFRGGETAIVVVSGDGDTDLDLMVYNPSGDLVASDTDSTDDCVVSWTPSRTQTYTIKVKNYGSVYNRYRMAVN